MKQTGKAANALRHTPAGGRIEIETRAEGGEALPRVRDNGAGMVKRLVEQQWGTVAWWR